MLKLFSKNQKGANLVEYALLVALVAVAAGTAMTALKNNISDSYSLVGSRLISAS